MEHAPLRPVPSRAAGPIDPAAAARELAAALPDLSQVEARALALVAVAAVPRADAAVALGVDERTLSDTLAKARKELRRSVTTLPGSGWCERAERLISDRLDDRPRRHRLPPPRRPPAQLPPLRGARAPPGAGDGRVGVDPRAKAGPHAAAAEPAEPLTEVPSQPPAEEPTTDEPAPPQPAPGEQPPVEVPPAEDAPPAPQTTPPTEVPPVEEPPVEEPAWRSRPSRSRPRGRGPASRAGRRCRGCRGARRRADTAAAGCRHHLERARHPRRPARARHDRLHGRRHPGRSALAAQHLPHRARHRLHPLLMGGGIGCDDFHRYVPGL